MKESDLPPNAPEGAKRLLRRFEPGERIVASTAILYGTGEEVAEGYGGLMVGPAPGFREALWIVRWDGWEKDITVAGDLIDLDVAQQALPS